MRVLLSLIVCVLIGVSFGSALDAEIHELLMETLRLEKFKLDVMKEKARGRNITHDVNPVYSE